MEQKISKLATVVAKAARMEKKAEYYDAIATFINPDGNYFEKRKFMGEYTEDEIIKEVLKEFPKVKKEDIDIEFGVQSSQKIKMHKKAEWSEDNFQGLWDMSFANRIVFKSILKNMSLEQQSNFSKWMQANKTEDEIRAFNEKYTLDELLSSKRIKLYKKAKLRKKAAAMTKEQILEDIFQNNIEFDDESKEARLTDDKGRLVEIFELSEKEEDLRKQFDKYVEENDLLDDKHYYFEKNEQAKEEDAYLDSYDYLYSLLVNGNISLYKERLAKMTGKEIVQYINWAEEMGIGKEKLKLNYIESSKKQRFSKKASMDLEEVQVFADDIKTICKEIEGFGPNISKDKIVQKFNKIIELANDVIEEMK